MSSLDEFLNLNDVMEIKETIPIIVNGKKLEIVVRPISETEHNEFQRRANEVKRNKLIFDSGKYKNLILESCIVEPNFKDAEFLKKAGCLSASEFINKKFPAGAVANIVERIQKLSGFDSYDMEIENAKN